MWRHDPPLLPCSVWLPIPIAVSLVGVEVAIVAVTEWQNHRWWYSKFRFLATAHRLTKREAWPLFFWIYIVCVQCLSTLFVCIWTGLYPCQLFRRTVYTETELYPCRCAASISRYSILCFRSCPTTYMTSRYGNASCMWHCSP